MLPTSIQLSPCIGICVQDIQIVESLFVVNQATEDEDLGVDSRGRVAPPTLGWLATDWLFNPFRHISAWGSQLEDVCVIQSYCFVGTLQPAASEDEDSTTDKVGRVPSSCAW